MVVSDLIFNWKQKSTNRPSKKNLLVEKRESCEKLKVDTCGKEKQKAYEKEILLVIEDKCLYPVINLSEGNPYNYHNLHLFVL